MRSDEVALHRAAKRLINNPDFQLVVGTLVAEYQLAMYETEDEDVAGRERWFRKARAVEDVLGFVTAAVDEGKRVEVEHG